MQYAYLTAFLPSWIVQILKLFGLWYASMLFALASTLFLEFISNRLGYTLDSTPVFTLLMLGLFQSCFIIFVSKHIRL